MRQATCSDCGRTIDVASNAGPLPRRCPQCSAPYVENLQRQRRARRTLRAHGQPQRATACADCGAAIEWLGLGRPKERCDPCRRARTQAKNRERSLAWVRANPERVRELQRQGYQRNAEAIRAKKLDEHYRHKYGLTIADRERMLAEQDSKCAICDGQPHPNHRGTRLHVDHDHATGRVRGLLCGHCNTMLGLAREDPQVLLKAIEYLTRKRG